jgi:sulfide:quinone oxidoreductase
MTKPRVVILGAGFGGLELSALLWEALGDDIDVTLIDKSDGFVFGFSKLDVLFGQETAAAVKTSYRNLAKRGVRFLQRTITAIDPQRRRVTAGWRTYKADFLIVALGADYDWSATPGLAEAGEFYSVPGTIRLRRKLQSFRRGKALIATGGAPYKCPPGPSECALLLHDDLVKRQVRDRCEISLVSPFASPIPPSPETSSALLEAFAERGVTFVPGRRVVTVDNASKTATFDDGSRMPFDLFLGVPKHRVPEVVARSGLAGDAGWIKVNPRTLETGFPGVYAVGDCAGAGTAMAGVFAEGMARAVASDLIRRIGGAGEARSYDGRGVCYIEFGGGRVGKVEMDFFALPRPKGVFHAPSLALRADKQQFASSRLARWFAGQNQDSTPSFLWGA